ncbi:hypothetical protein ACWEOP_27560 [Streptomyces chartreusis]
MPTTPSHRFWITDPEPIEGAADNLKEVLVSLVPAGSPSLLVRWHYRIRDDRAVEGPFGVRVGPAPDADAEDWQTINATLVRDLPLTKLEKAARSALTYGLRDPSGAPLSGTGILAAVTTAPREIPLVARETVRERHPEVDPEGGPAAARRWNRLVRLAEVWLEHQAAQARGEKAPATVVAEARGVAPATVRSWLHHAKQEGLDSSADSSFTAVAGEPASDE